MCEVIFNENENTTSNIENTEPKITLVVRCSQKNGFTVQNPRT